MLHARVWAAQTFPWRPGYRARRILGSIGAGWYLLHLVVTGVMIGRDLDTLSNASIVLANLLLGLALMYQTPRRPCRTCHGDA